MKVNTRVYPRRPLLKQPAYGWYHEFSPKLAMKSNYKHILMENIPKIDSCKVLLENFMCFIFHSILSPLQLWVKIGVILDFCKNV